MATSSNSNRSISIPTTEESDDYTFVDVLPDKYICGICRNILLQPHVTECCGQHFCEDCLKKSASQSTRPKYHGLWLQQMESETPNCPHCRQSNFNHIRYLPFKREVDSMKVHCPRKYSGCNVQVAYGNRVDHDKTCGYIRVPCTNNCGKNIFKKDLNSHTKKTCMLRKATCKACGKVGTYTEIQGSQHNFVCPEAILKCLNSCGAQFKRKAAESHDSVCPEATVECQFAEAGCDVKPKRKDLESHLDANMKQHLSQLMTAHVKMKKEFQAFKEGHGDPSASPPLSKSTSRLSRIHNLKQKQRNHHKATMEWSD